MKIIIDEEQCIFDNGTIAEYLGGVIRALDSVNHHLIMDLLSDKDLPESIDKKKVYEWGFEFLFNDFLEKFLPTVARSYSSDGIDISENDLINIAANVVRKYFKDHESEK